MRTSFLAWGLFFIWCCGASAQQAEPESVQRKRLERWMQSPSFASARQALGGLLPSILEDQIALARIPAPTGQEQARAQWMFQRLQELGLQDVRIDDVGNVLARRPGTLTRPVVVLSAHLDTVFEQGTIQVIQDGPVLRAPGIADDARGLASVLGLLRALQAGAIETEGDLWIALTVGEEGLGDLRGAKHLYAENGLGRRADAFLSLDLIESTAIVHRAVGSLRMKIEVSGPGGHSWSDFGRPNPIQALGRGMNCMGAEPYSRPSGSRSSFNFGRIGGGTSINSIPASAWVEVDLRSEDAGELRRLELKLDSCFRGAVEAERAWARAGEEALKVDFQVVGRRPGGHLPEEHALVRLASGASELLGIEPRRIGMSTDANVALGLGLPALALGYGGRGGYAHSPSEWYDPTGCLPAMERNLLLLLALLEQPR